LAELSYNVPISQIPNYISQKAEEKKGLEEQIRELETKKSKVNQDTISALEKYTITQEKLNWHSKIKDELEQKYGIPVDDISKLGVIVNNLANFFGHDAQK
jgi:hypothetical protein